MPNSITNNYSYINKNQSAGKNEYWYEEDDATTSVSMDDFLSLMMAQLKNQDFNNATDNTEFINQLASFSMLSSLQQMNQYAENSYASNLIGHEVAVLDGNTIIYGKVEAMSIVNNKPVLFINEKQYSLSDIKQVYEADTTINIIDGGSNSDSSDKEEEDDTTTEGEAEATSYSSGLLSATQEYRNTLNSIQQMSELLTNATDGTNDDYRNSLIDFYKIQIEALSKIGSVDTDESDTTSYDYEVAQAMATSTLKR